MQAVFAGLNGVRAVPMRAQLDDRSTSASDVHKGFTDGSGR